MIFTPAVRRAFEAELAKTAGLTRSGIRPISASTLAKKKATFGAGARRFVRENFMQKVSATRKHVAGAAAAGVAAGAIGGRVAEKKLKKVYADYQLGKQIRKAQEGQ